MPDRIVVCAGFTQGLELVCEVLRGTGTRSLAVESYGHAGHRQIAARAGLRLTPLPVDDRGAAVTALASRAGGALLTPAHQFPSARRSRRSGAARWRTGRCSPGEW